MASDTVPRGEHPPGPDGWERVQLLWDLFTNTDAPSEVVDGKTLAEYREEYGPVVRLETLVGDDVYFLTNPAQVEYVLETNARNFRKAESRVADLRVLFGDGVLTASGDDVARHRGAVASLVSTRTLDSFEDVVVEETEAKVRRWVRSDGATNVHSAAIGLVSDVLGRVVFGSDYEDCEDDVHESFELFEQVMPRVFSPVPTAPDWLPTPHNRTVERARSIFDDAVSRVVRKRRRNGNDHDDVLGAMLAADVDLTDAELRDQTRTLLIAGLVTAPALARALYALARYPDKLDALRASLPGRLDAREAGNEELSYCEQVVDETLRLYPPIPPAIREAIDDDTIGGYRVPAGSKLILSQLPIHRDPDLWEDPLAFHPERFADGWNDDRPRYSYFPFSGGPRTCVGGELARETLKLALATFVIDYDLELTDESRGREHAPFESQTFHVNVERRE
ncbi:hypothetical protein BRC81_05525 [Halobacteriales archaeon QS_1_68_20]|nr:MAG: hypothetical protein BRC81_05525 [Halobacteriales archaeon QS_1_68_20]